MIAGGGRLLSLWGPVLAYMGVLFVLSAQSQLPAISTTISDKLVHSAAYLGLGLLTQRAFHGGKRSPRAAALGGLMLAVLYGITDEWHQSFVPGRVAALSDVVANTLGAVLAMVVWQLARGRRGSGETG